MGYSFMGSLGQLWVIGQIYFRRKLCQKENPLYNNINESLINMILTWNISGTYRSIWVIQVVKREEFAQVHSTFC